MDAVTLRRTWNEFFEARQHALVPSASLIPTHPTAPMFTNSGMMQFVPYFLGEEPVPFDPPRASSIQKCVRLAGKHNDIDEIGRTRRHLTFFEMLGNWSFGEYYQLEAIKWAWELVLAAGFDGDRIWPTVHLSDDAAEAIWHEEIGIPMERIQRLDKDNFWEMGETGPCGPVLGDPLRLRPRVGRGGRPRPRRRRPLHRVLEPRVHARLPPPRRVAQPAARPERRHRRRVRALADAAPGRPQRDRHRHHAAAPRHRPVDHRPHLRPRRRRRLRPARPRRPHPHGELPRERRRRPEQRGPRLRAAPADPPRRALRLPARRAGRRPPAPRHVLHRHDGRRLPRPRRQPRLRARHPRARGGQLPHHAHPRRHAARGDLRQRARPRCRATSPSSCTTPSASPSRSPRRWRPSAASASTSPPSTSSCRSSAPAPRRRARRATSTPTARASSRSSTTTAPPSSSAARRWRPRPPCSRSFPATATRCRSSSTARRSTRRAAARWATPASIRTDTGTAVVDDTTYGLPGLHRHHARIVEGAIEPGQEATAAIDVDRRDAIRRNHTGTHVLHWALRKVLGENVKQQGSLVDPDRLRFDFGPSDALTAAQIQEIEDLANAEILANDPVRHYETTKAEAANLGAIAFFGDKYGDIVRVLEAGRHSIELCGGTHVRALGDIGPVKIVSESSIGANLRRIEAVTGTGPIERLREEERRLAELAEVLNVPVGEVVDGARKRLEEIKALRDEIKVPQAPGGRRPGLDAGGQGGRRRDRRARRRPRARHAPRHRPGAARQGRPPRRRPGHGSRGRWRGAGRGGHPRQRVRRVRAARGGQEAHQGRRREGSRSSRWPAARTPTASTPPSTACEWRPASTGS